MKPDWQEAAAYGPGGELTLNFGRLGSGFFRDRSWEALQRINELLLHEFAHEYAVDHFTLKFSDSLALLGARLAKLALEKPGLFSGIGPPNVFCPDHFSRLSASLTISPRSASMAAGQEQTPAIQPSIACLV